MDNSYIETLRARQQEATRKLVLAQQNLQHAQNAFNIASQQATSWNVVLSAEMQRLQQEAALEAAVEAVSKSQVAPSPEPSQPITASVSESGTPGAPEISKTELVRGVLRQHPNGITPNEITMELKNQVSNAYVHSVLHRLKDREVTKRRGKYFLKQNPQPQSEDVAVHNGVVQQQH